MPGRIACCVLDDVVPDDVARKIRAGFPDRNKMMLKKSLREHKLVCAQMNQCAPLLEEAVYAFQHPDVLEQLRVITGIQEILADERLYAGGISMMTRGHFLTPHIDNSHDGARANYRVLNLLYYVSPDWREEDGGNLELWDDGLRGRPRTVWSRFNRLVVMATNRSSFHSVSPISCDAARCCVSNYYFSPHPPDGHDYYHVTSFRGWPHQRWRDLVLRADNRLRQTIRVWLPSMFENPHIYRR